MKNPCAVAYHPDLDCRLYYCKAESGEWFIAFNDQYDTQQYFRPNRETGEKWLMLLQEAYSEGEPLMDHPYGVTMVRLSWLRKDASKEDLASLDSLERFIEAHPPKQKALEQRQSSARARLEW